MIQIERIEIANFRGIRNLTLNPKRNSFGIFGPNGTGKSSIVDAIEFALTGYITRFKGRGKVGVTIPKHASHIEENDKKNSHVTLHLFLPAINKSVTVARNTVSKKRKVEPPDLDILAILDEAASHREIALTRREIADLIVIQAGDRASAILKLLRLDNLKKTREGLRKAWTTAVSETKERARTFESAIDAIKSVLPSDDPFEKNILSSINDQLATLGLTQYAHLEDVSSLAHELEKSTNPTGRINKQSALAELDRFSAGITDLSLSIPLESLPTLWADYDNPLKRDEAKLRQLIELGQSLIVDDTCPLCTAEKNQSELGRELKERLDDFQKQYDNDDRILEYAQECACQAHALLGDLHSLIHDAETLELEHERKILDAVASTLQTITQNQDSLDKISKNRDAFHPSQVLLDQELINVLERLKAAIGELPDESETTQTKNNLLRVSGFLTNYVVAKKRLLEAKAVEDLAQKVLLSYNESVESVLEDLYQKISDDFAKLYREINSEDEGMFNVKFDIKAKSVDLAVDFHQRGLHPASAYHSEGHQDGMGLCLYLALMKQLLKSEFKLVLLDDVIMSVDQAHRRKLCYVLKDNFPNTQFIITTHDRTWFQQMQKAELINRKSSVRILDWSVDHGPVIESARTDWEEVDRALRTGDIPSAAHRLRRLLEANATELSDLLGAKVAYRADNNYNLGELLPAVYSRVQELRGKASDAAQQWKRVDEQEQLKDWKSKLASCYKETQIDDWTINKAVHFNSWADFSRNDFEPVVTAFKQLFQQFKCTHCNSWLQITKTGRVDASIMCDCNKTNFNLKLPTKEQKQS